MISAVIETGSKNAASGGGGDGVGDSGGSRGDEGGDSVSGVLEGNCVGFQSGEEEFLTRQAMMTTIIQVSTGVTTKMTTATPAQKAHRVIDLK